MTRRRQTVPPAHPRRPRWAAPLIGTCLVESLTGDVWQVRQSDAASQMVQLTAAHPPANSVVERWRHASDIDSDYEQVLA